MTSEHIKHLLSSFAEAATEQDSYMQSGEWAEGNREHDRLEHLFQQIIDEGDDGRQALLELVDNQDPVVAMAAAVHSLPYHPERCIALLQRVATEPGFLGFTAIQALMRWEEGNWHLEDKVGEDYRAKDVNKSIRTTGKKLSADPNLNALLVSLPTEVSWEAIPEFDLLDERVSWANAFCPFTIGVNEGYLEWVPDNDPPSEEEMLAWAWVIRPDLAEAITAKASPEFRKTIIDYASVKNAKSA